MVLPVRRAEYSFLSSGGRPIGVLLLDPERDVLYSRFREDLDDEAIALWAEEIPAAARELGGARYLELLEDRLSNAVGISDRESAFVREFPVAVQRLYERRVLGEGPAGVRELPVYSLRAAAGRFGEDMEVEPEERIAAPPWIRVTPGTFAVHVKGHSMEPLVPDGSIAVFRHIGGSRVGKRVLVWRRATSGGGGEFTVKVYHSNKSGSDGSWRHTQIVLKPLNPDYDEVVLTDEDEYRVLGEFVTVLALEDCL
ncbi:MAG: S24 family peptidase [bacterium]|jgi:SOS-response transcriptional repressor LexA